MVRISLYDVEFTGFQSARYQPVVELFAEPDYPEGDMQIERQYHNEILGWAAAHAMREAQIRSYYLRSYYYGMGRDMKEVRSKIVSQYIKYLLSDDLVAESVVSAIDLLSSPAYTENDVMVDLEVDVSAPDEQMLYYAMDAIHDFLTN